jgi:catalase
MFGFDRPILLQDFHLIEVMANFDCDRQQHVKGGGAFGCLVGRQDTGDVSIQNDSSLHRSGQTGRT